MENWKCSCGQVNSGSICTKCHKSFQGNGNMRRYTNACIYCGLVHPDSTKYCVKCGYHVETVKCPACGKITNPMEATCNYCHSSVFDLVDADLNKYVAVYDLLHKSEAFKEIQPNDQMFRLASLKSIAGLAAIFAFEAAAKRAGTYKDHFAHFVYEENSPDNWDNPSEWYNPREHYASKQEYIEAIWNDSKRPDFGFLAWAFTYAKNGKDIQAYKLCLRLANLLNFMASSFDNGGYLISQSGVELRHQAYELLCVAQTNPQVNYSNDDVAKEMFANVRYMLARQYFTIEYFGFNDSDEDGDNSGFSKYFSNYKDGYKKALDILKGPRVEDQTQAKLLRGMMYFNINENKNFIDAWNITCKDSNYINSEKDYIDDGIFALSAIFMADIARQHNDFEYAKDTLRFAFSHITRQHWAEVLQEEYSKYQ